MKFWNMANLNETEAEITLYGDICDSQPTDWWTGEPVSGLFITPEGFLEDLEQIKGKSKITVKINSCGGDFYTGLAIHNALKGLSGHKTVVVEGIAASAASIIMCAGDDVQVYPGSIVMVHGISGVFMDYVTLPVLKQAIKGFEAAEKSIAEIYSVKTGREVGVLRSLMTKETWMVGQEAIDEGFANTIIKGQQPEVFVSADKKFLLAAGVPHNVQYFRNIPGSIPVKNSFAADSTAVNNKSNEGSILMKTPEELRAAYPDLIAAIENGAVKTAAEDAVKNERQRIREIEDIAIAVGDDALVNEAKYDKPCTAQELSFMAMQKQSKLGAEYLANVHKNYAASGAKDVGASPIGGDKPGEGKTDENATPDQLMAAAKAEVALLLGKKGDK